MQTMTEERQAQFVGKIKAVNIPDRRSFYSRELKAILNNSTDLVDIMDLCYRLGFKRGTSYGTAQEKERESRRR